jgi:hypothetical protein
MLDSRKVQSTGNMREASKLKRRPLESIAKENRTQAPIVNRKKEESNHNQVRKAIKDDRDLFIATQEPLTPTEQVRTAPIEPQAKKRFTN